jgi:hypothetical protein
LTSDKQRFTQDEIHDFAVRWFQALDRHEPAEEMESFLDGDALELTVPEDTFHGLAGFRVWYERALRLFFDESHTLKEVTRAGSDGDFQTVKVKVNWQCRSWTPPNAHSKNIDMDAFQTWILSPDASGKPRILQYVVDEARFRPGSATL